MAATPGKLGEYEIEREISRGGMGVVWLARAPDGTRVAIKTMLARMADNDDMIKRFLREARAAQALDHPNVVPIVGEGEDAGTHYFAMRYVEGQGLDDLIDEGPIPIRRAVEITRAVADALGHAHAEGIIHRDVKPSNIMIATDGTPQLTDFGLARSIEVSTALTKSGSCIGTPDYMPPEQAQGHLRKIDGRSDLYSLGVALYEMLTCKTPFEADNPSGVIYKVLTEEPKSPRIFNAEVDGRLEAICMKMIEKDPDRRYPDAAAVVADLDAWLTGGRVSARRPSSVSRFARKAGSAKGRRLIAGAVVLLAAGVAGGWLWVRGAEERAAQAAEAARALKAKQVEALLGTTELESPDPDRRLGDLDRALSLVPEWAPWLADRAVAQLELGLFDGALADCAAVAAQQRAPAPVRARAAMIAMLVHGLGRADGGAAAAVAAPEGAGSYGALARALRAAFGGSGEAAKAALASAGDDLAEGALPWERAVVAAVVAERAGDPAEALAQYVRSIRARSKAPSFALGLHGMARAALASAKGGATTIPPGDTAPGAPLVLTEPDPYQRAFAALVEATRRVPSLAPARADLRALCTAAVDGAGVGAAAGAPVTKAIGLERALLTRAQLALCEGRWKEAETDLLAVEAGKAPEHVRVATALRGLALWTLRGDAAAAKKLLDPLAALPAYSSHPAKEREPVEVARRAKALLDDPAAEWPPRLNFITPFGRWASGWLKPRSTSAKGRLTELDHQLFGSAGQPGARAWPYLAAWPPALAAWAELRRAETEAWVRARPGERAAEADLADLAGADGERLAAIAVRELPGLTLEAAASADPAALRDRIAQARYAAALAARRRVTRARLTVALAVWPECEPLQAQLAALDAK